MFIQDISAGAFISWKTTFVRVIQKQHVKRAEEIPHEGFWKRSARPITRARDL